MISIEAQNLTKIYRLYQSPTQRLKEIITRKPCHTQFVALDNINFSIYTGETFGVIGENGAGKSTLLKILARTLKPTNGKLAISGRTAALLELGAGFNPELTGDENIYLNGYLMGLSKAEMQSKRQEIIDFSELGNFIAQPVKTYSSGMHVRLAFSIATSVNPEILIVDEALSVGDEYFQKKCIDRMMSFKKVGKTILFCSHSMYHVQELCQRAMCLHKGKIRNLGDTGQVISDYQNYERGRSAVLKEKAADMDKVPLDVSGKQVRIIDVKILNSRNSETETLKTFEPMLISFKIQCERKDLTGHIGFAFIRNDEVMSFGTMTHYDGLAALAFSDGQEFRIQIPSLPLMTGLYSIMVVASDEFAVHPYDIVRTKAVPVLNSGKEFGLSYIEHQWVL